MNVPEFLILEAVNIASTRYRHPGRDYECTAAEIAEVIRTDDRLGSDYPSWMLYPNSRQVGNHLGAMSSPRRRSPLVERVDSRRWKLAQGGLDVLTA